MFALRVTSRGHCRLGGLELEGLELGAWRPARGLQEAWKFNENLSKVIGNWWLEIRKFVLGAVSWCLGEVRLLPRLLQAGEPGPRGRVGKGKSKYLRYLDSKWISSTRLEAKGLGGLVGALLWVLKLVGAL